MANSIASQRFSSSCWAHSQGWLCCWPALESMACCRTWSGSVHGKSVCAWLLERSGFMYCAWCWKTERA